MTLVPLAVRVVEVIADLGDHAERRYRYGSGCIVRGRTVLTAAHVVADAETVRVRGPDKVLRSTRIDPQFVGGGSAPDLALVDIDEQIPELPAMDLAVLDRDSATAEPLEGCHAIGYPWFMEQPSPLTVRETADAYGHVPVLSRLVDGLLTVQVSSSPRPLPPGKATLGESEWSGMSGAPVVVDGCLLGIVTEHAPRQGPSAITATPLSFLEADPAHPGWGSGVGNAAQWWARLGVSSITELQRVPASTLPLETAYRATVREVHRRTPQLLGREHQLAELANFATGREGYRWLVAGIYEGKTSLVAEAVTAALPPQVDVVVYFMSRREADADSNRFVAATVPQLARLLAEDAPIPDLYTFRALWQRAVDRAAATDRHLLLAVDGLDEDLHPHGSLTVAAVLPVETGDRAHVLVTSRPLTELPADIPIGHPLRYTRPMTLEPFEGAASRSELARQEIDDLLRRDVEGLVAEVFGLLTAAAGPLSVSDLVALTSGLEGPVTTRSRLIRRLITEAAARSLQPVGPDEARRYQFAHSSLLEYSQTNDDLRHPDYLSRIHTWAQRWRDAGWPVTATVSSDPTPRYLLEAYPVTLDSDPQRLAALVTDVGWVVAAIQAAGVDSVLAALHTARSAAPAAAGVSAILSTLRGQAHNLRPPQPVSQPGYVLRQLCIQAAELGDNQLAADTHIRLQALTGFSPIPQWTTRRASRALSAELGSHDGRVRAMAVLPDGRVVSGGDDGRVLVWDPAAIASPLRLGAHRSIVRAVAVLPDGRVVSGGDDRRVLVWDPAAVGTDPLELGRHGREVRAVAVLPDGRVVSAGDDWRVLMWNPDAADVAPVRLGGHHGIARALAVLPNGRVVSGGDDGRLFVWDPAAVGSDPIELGGHYGIVRAVAVLPDGRVVSGGDDGRIRVWNPAPELIRYRRPNGASAGTLVGFARHGGRVRVLTVLSDGRLVSGGDGWMRMWEVPTAGRATAVGLGSHDGMVRAVAVLPDGRVVSGGDDRRVRVWDPTLGDSVTTLGSLGGMFLTVAVLPDGRLVSGGYDGRVLIWDPAAVTGRPIEVGRHSRRVGAVAVLPDGRLVSGGDDGRVLIWEPTTASAAQLALPFEVGRHSRAAGAVAVLPDGRVVSGGDDGRVLIWDPAVARTDPIKLGRHSGAAQAVAVLPDGRVVSAGDDGRVRVWDPASLGEAAIEVGRHDGMARTLVALPDGRVVSAGDDRRVRVWDVSAQVECARVSCSAVALAVATRSDADDCQLVMAHEGGGISKWSFVSAQTQL